MKIQSRPPKPPAVETFSIARVESMAKKLVEAFPAEIARQRLRGMLGGLQLLGHIDEYDVYYPRQGHVRAFVSLPDDAGGYTFTIVVAD